MEKQTSSGLTAQDYSVRIVTNDESRNFLGSGTLLIRKASQTVWLLTCVHVFFPKDKSSQVWNGEVEYHRNGNGVPFEIDWDDADDADDNDEDKPHEPGWVMFGKCDSQNIYVVQNPASCERDFLCLKLQWESWMNELNDTELGAPEAGGEYFGYGFSSFVNSHDVKDSGSPLRTRAGNVQPSFFSVGYHENFTQTADAQMVGYSGTGLFSGDGKLVGMVVGRYGSADNYEATAVRVDKLAPFWNRSQAATLQDFCMVRVLHAPFAPKMIPREKILPSMRLELNLFTFLSGIPIPGDVNVFLLNGEGAPVQEALNEKKLGDLLQRRKWISRDASLRLSKKQQSVTNGLVIHMKNTEEDWTNAGNLAKNYRQQGEKLILFDIDVSAEQPNFRNIEKQITSQVVGSEPFFLFATHALFRANASPNHALSEQAENLCREAENKLTPYLFFLDEAEQKPALLPNLLEACLHSEAPRNIRVAGLRLTVLFGVLSDSLYVKSLILREDKDFLCKCVYPELRKDEKLDLLDILSYENSEDARALMEKLLSPDDDAWQWSEVLSALTKEEPWSIDALQEILSEPPTPLLFQMILRCLNWRTREPEQNRLAVDRFFDRPESENLYWQFLLCCRWGTEELCRRIETSERETNFLPLLLMPKPDMSTGAWRTADSIRADLSRVFSLSDSQ